MDVFHLGPVGALRALPSPSLGTGPDATAVRLGAVHRSLTGRVTIDRLAVRRTWALSWPYLDPTVHAFLDALHLGIVPGPLWLLDPQRANRLTLAVAATGSPERTTTGFTATAGTLAWSAAVPVSTLPIAGGLSWAVPAAGGQLAHVDPVPVLPGETVTASAWVTATVPVRLSVSLYDRTDALLTTVQSDPITPGAGGTRLTLPLVPGATAAFARLALTVPASTATTLTTAAWQLEAAATASPWSPGGGAAVVAVDALTTAYPVPGTRATALTLLEV